MWQSRCGLSWAVKMTPTENRTEAKDETVSGQKRGLHMRAPGGAVCRCSLWDLNTQKADNTAELFAKIVPKFAST